MKRVKMVAVAVLFASMAFSVFAQTSNKKIATAGLIGDGLVDSFKPGISDNKGLLWGTYHLRGANFHLFDAAVGFNITDALWVGVYESGYFNDHRITVNAAQNGSHTSDGIHIDWVDENRSKSRSNGIGGMTYYNYLAVPFAINHALGGKAYWTIGSKNNTNTHVRPEMDPTTAQFTNTTTTGISGSETDKGAGIVTTENAKGIRNYSAYNKWGISFLGIGLPETGNINFYVQLNDVSLALQEDNVKTLNYTAERKKNGVVIESETQKGDSWHSFLIPAVEAELGFSLPSFGLMNTTFALVDNFEIAFPMQRTVGTVTTLDDRESVINIKETKTVDYKAAKNTFNGFWWSNTFTPRLTSSFDFGDRLTVKARVGADIKIGNYGYDASGTGNFVAGLEKTGRGTTTTTTETYDYTTLGTTKVTQVVDDVVASTKTTRFTTEISPALSIGASYAVKPGKFLINVGTKLVPATFKWQTDTTTNISYTAHNYTETTDEFGNTTRSGETWTTSPSIGSEPIERVQKFYNVNQVNADFYLGATWFMGDKFILDILGFAANTALSIKEAIWDASLGVQFKILF
ncbi:MAG: hypothetical protein J6I73_10365 [Treponema sp.]|nr:hypothetical protein [Treponema sp.]